MLFKKIDCQMSALKNNKKIAFSFLKQCNLKDRNKLRNFLENRTKKEGLGIKELQIIFCSDKYLLNINKLYLKHAFLTDIITFSYSDKKGFISGDLFISIDRVKENARLFNSTLTKEIHRVIFHGVLHLIGYNDKTDKEKKEIRREEDLWLSKYGL